MLPRSVILCLVGLALSAAPVALAAERGPNDPNDDFLADEGLTAASAVKAEKTPPNPAASEGLESREGWRLAAWEDKGELSKLDDPNKPGNTLLRLATEGGKMGKSGAVLGNVMLPAEAGALTLSAYNPGPAEVKISIGYFLFDERYFETSAQALPAGQWKALRFDLAAADYKSLASKWQNNALLPKRFPVRSTCLLLHGGGKKAAAFYDGVKMDCLELPTVKLNAPLQLGRELAKGPYNGYVTLANSNELRLANDNATRPADRELVLRARSGLSGPDRWYQEFVDRAVFRQLMPGDIVQVGWCELAGGGRGAVWIMLTQQFPRSGKAAGKVKAPGREAGTLDIELAGLPPAQQHANGKCLALRLAPAELRAPDAATMKTFGQLGIGMQVEVEYEHSGEYGVLIKSLKSPEAEKAAEKPPAKLKDPPPPPPPPPPPVEKPKNPNDDY